MNNETGACAPSHPMQNGISVNADRDFGAIEISMVVNGQRVTLPLKTCEATQLSEALQGAVCKMMGDDTCGGRVSQEELEEISKRYREDKEYYEAKSNGNELLPKE